MERENVNFFKLEDDDEFDEKFYIEKSEFNEVVFYIVVVFVVLYFVKEFY